MDNVIVSQNNVCIIDSYKIRRTKEMSKILNDARAEYKFSDVWERSNYSLNCEWLVHNCLYNLGLWVSHTKDVDLNYPQKWYEVILYGLFGTILYPFHI